MVVKRTLKAFQNQVNRNVHSLVHNRQQGMEDSMNKHHDPWATLVVVLTLVLFIMALFIKGLKHDMLLEAAVFLVSLKLILLGIKNRVIAGKTEKQLEQIHALLLEMRGPSQQLPLNR